ncbi:hypothetical protein GCM10011408_27620 [Dyella caseinilytica]|nr:hypothetical protein GCM10011408_27620 [Dyella caseinilytica]
MVIGARIGAANDHDDEIAVNDALVTHRRLEQMTVFVNPALKIEGRQQGHAANPTGEAATITPIRRYWEDMALEIVPTGRNCPPKKLCA